MPLRPNLRWFAKRMEEVLKANDHKSPIATHKLFNNMVHEVFELHSALGRVNTLKPELTPTVLRNKAIKESIDVANYAMMIAARLR